MGNRHTGWLTNYNQRVEGMLAFAGHVLGERDAQYLELLTRYQQATTSVSYTHLTLPTSDLG